LATEFEIDGRRFEVEPLNLDESFAQLANVEAIFQRTDLAKVPALLRAFAKVSKVSRSPDGSFVSGGPMIALEHFVKDVFTGKQTLAMTYLSKCVEHEYGAFFEEMAAKAAAAASTPPTP
jgi:hypothetical protein